VHPRDVGGWAALAGCAAIAAGCGSAADETRATRHTTVDVPASSTTAAPGVSTTESASTTSIAVVPTTVEPATTTEQVTTTSTTVAAPTSAAPTSSPAPAEPVAPAAVLHVDVPPRTFPIEGLDPCEPELCPSIAVTPNGDLVVYDARTDTLRTGNPPTQVVPLAEELTGRDGYLVHIGPDDVAYIVVDLPVQSDPIGEVVAIATHGPRAGEIIGRGGGIDMSGDSDLVPTARGLVWVGC